jgi:ABC-type transporter Mla subunit MlaD
MALITKLKQHKDNNNDNTQIIDTLRKSLKECKDCKDNYKNYLDSVNQFINENNDQMFDVIKDYNDVNQADPDDQIRIDNLNPSYNRSVTNPARANNARIDINSRLNM